MSAIVKTSSQTSRGSAAVVVETVGGKSLVGFGPYRKTNPQSTEDHKGDPGRHSLRSFALRLAVSRRLLFVDGSKMAVEQTLQFARVLFSLIADLRARVESGLGTGRASGRPRGVM